ncbi:MAG: SDR family oxidoreductase [Thermodesulfobacteriota bacterium]
MTREDILLPSDPAFNPENVCLVTGAASGIGRALVLAAAANGLTCLGLDIDPAGGAETVRLAGELTGKGGRAVFCRADLTRDEEVEAAVAQAAGLGRVRYLANVAGLQHIDPIDKFPMAKFDLMHALMLRAPFLLSKLAIPLMRRNADGVGVIGNMASIHAHVSTLNKPAYNIMKFGLRGLTQSIAAEGEGRIRAFTVSTGFVATPLALKQIPAQAEQRGISPEAVVREVMLGKSRVKELMRPVEVANIFIFAFSRFANYLVGGDLLFDGGVVLTY